MIFATVRSTMYKTYTAKSEAKMVSIDACGRRGGGGGEFESEYISLIALPRCTLAPGHIRVFIRLRTFEVPRTSISNWMQMKFLQVLLPEPTGRPASHVAR